MSKFFEAVKKTGENLGGVELPFSSAEIPAATERKPGPRPQPEPADATRVTAFPPPSFRTANMRVSAHAPVLPFDGTHLSAAEHYRIIRTRIVQHPAKPRLLCVSSTSMGDGKTVNALNIACSLALKHGSTALLVDVDLRRPQLAGLLGVPESPGLSDILGSACTPREAIVQLAELPSLYFLPAGRRAQNPAELLDSEAWRRLIASFRNDFDFTIIDSPPVGVVADYDLIQAACDALILIARPGHTDRGMLQKGMSRMPKDKLLGVVINCAEDWFLWHPHPSYYGSYYARTD